MFLPPSSEKVQLTPLPQKLPNKVTEKAVFFVQTQALPVGWSVLKLSLGLSGIFNVLGGSTALAASGFQGPEPTDSLTATKANHPQSRLWETTRSSQGPSTQAPSPTPSPTELSFHPAPLLTDMGPLTRTLTNDEAIAHNHSQRLAIQTGHQPKFSTASPTRTAPEEAHQAEAHQAEVHQAEVNALPTHLRLPLDKPPLDIAKLSEQITLSALSQPTASHVVEGNAAAATVQPKISLEALITGSVADENRLAENLITEEIADSEEGVPSKEGVPSEESVPSKIEVLPDGNEEEGLEIGPDIIGPDIIGPDIGEDIGPGVLPDALEAPESENAETANNELGTLRVQPTRSRASEELGILRLMQTAQAPPPPPKPPISFLTGRLGFFSSENAFRSNPRIDESIYQSGLAYYLFPKLADGTSLYAIAETNLARYDQFQSVNYNELEVQLGVRQRLLPRTYAQVGWRNQRLYSPGYRDKLFSVNYIDTMVSHRSILNSKTWVDGFYQARLGFANPETASRFRQTFTVSLNYGATRDLRTSLLYQLDFDDYTQVSRYDTYQQLLGIVSYNLTPESRISVFGGTRFGRSSSPGVNLDDTFYGAGLNVSVPIF